MNNLNAMGFRVWQPASRYARGLKSRSAGRFEVMRFPMKTLIQRRRRSLRRSEVSVLL